MQNNGIFTGCGYCGRTVKNLCFYKTFVAKLCMGFSALSREKPSTLWYGGTFISCDFTNASPMGVAVRSPVTRQIRPLRQLRPLFF